MKKAWFYIHVKRTYMCFPSHTLLSYTNVHFNVGKIQFKVTLFLFLSFSFFFVNENNIAIEMKTDDLSRKCSHCLRLNAVLLNYTNIYIYCI